MRRLTEGGAMAPEPVWSESPIDRFFDDCFEVSPATGGQTRGFRFRPDLRRGARRETLATASGLGLLVGEMGNSRPGSKNNTLDGGLGTRKDR